MSAVCHNNIYNRLPNDVGDTYDNTPQNQLLPPGPSEPKKFRCPPITVTGKSTKELRQFFSTENVPQDKYQMKVIKNGVQLILGSKQYFHQTISSLKQNGMQFYSYVPAEEIPVKIILSGLSMYDLEELKEELNSNNISPKEVKVFSVKKNGVEDNVLYMLHFEKGTVKLQELRKVRSLFNVIVRWRPYVKNKSDVVQCHRCQRFGHGKTNCNMNPLCVKCGERHESVQCKLPVKANLSESDRNNRAQIKCANCSGNHTANFRGCPARKTYLKSIEDRVTVKRKSQNPYTSPQGQSLLSPSVEHHRQPHNNNGRPRYSDVVRNSEAGGSGMDPDLFSISEFLSLARDMFLRLQGCRNKMEQFSALSELMLKYVYNA